MAEKCHILKMAEFGVRRRKSKNGVGGGTIRRTRATRGGGHRTARRHQDLGDG